MSIPPRFLDEIRSRIALSDIIGKAVKITRAGREFKACCPFHHEKTPSFTINDDKQFYHCFGCGAHGDVINFVMQNGNRSFIEAIEMLSAEAGLQMPEQTPHDIAAAKQQKDLYALLDCATDWFIAQLHAPENKNVHTYMLERGMSAETLAAFRVGYAPDDRQSLRVYLKGQDYSDKDMMDAGIVRTSEKSKEPYAFFRGRVMFPVADRRGRVVAYGGRVLPDHMRAPDRGDYTPAKYINSSDTPIFHKGSILYGESIARQAVLDGQDLLVVEGYMDVLACYQAGIKGSVAPMGTALTEEQILLLWKMIPRDEKVPILCFDGDNAGRSAAGRAVERIMPMLEPNQSVRIAFLPDGEDPDTLLRSGGTTHFKKILGAGMTLFDFLWETTLAGKKFETPEARAGVIESLKNNVKSIASRDVQSHYNQILQNKISETFFPRRKTGAYGGRRGNSSDKVPSLKIRSPARRAEGTSTRVLLAGILNHPYIYDMVEEQLGSFDISDQSYNRLRQEIVAMLCDDLTLKRDDLKAKLLKKGLEREIGDILCESVYVHAAFCSPDADSEDVGHKWLELWRAMQGKLLENEVQLGWKNAFHASNQEEEEKLRIIVQGSSSESN